MSCHLVFYHYQITRVYKIERLKVPKAVAKRKVGKQPWIMACRELEPTAPVTSKEHDQAQYLILQIFVRTFLQIATNNIGRGGYEARCH